MRQARIPAVLLAAVAWTLVTLIVCSCAAREPLVLADGTPNGRAIYQQRCSQCHALYDPAAFSDAQWARNVQAMGPRAGIRPEWRPSVLAWLQGANDAPPPGPR